VYESLDGISEILVPANFEELIHDLLKGFVPTCFRSMLAISRTAVSDKGIRISQAAVQDGSPSGDRAQV